MNPCTYHVKKLFLGKGTGAVCVEGLIKWERGSDGGGDDIFFKEQLNFWGVLRFAIKVFGAFVNIDFLSTQFSQS